MLSGREMKTEKTYLMTQFVDQFKGAASIRELQKDSMLYANPAYVTMAHKADSIKGAMLAAHSEREYRGMIFCEFVEQQFKKTNQPTFAFEEYDGMYVVTLRVLIEYNHCPAILTLISECKTLPTDLNNDLYTCPTAQYVRELDETRLFRRDVEKKH